MLIAEVPNAANPQVASTTFWLDPTHRRPLHPELLQFVASHCGFAKVDGWYLNPLGATPASQPGEATERVAAGDFTLIAWT